MVKYFVVGLWALLVCLNVATASTPVQLSLHSLEMKKSSEEVDELYLHVVAYPSDARPYHFRLPAFPDYWRSTHLQYIDNIKVFDATIKDGESLLLVVSLLEHDVPPWNNDDLIGTFKLHLKAEGGKIVHKWQKPNVKEDYTTINEDIASKTQVFNLSGDNSDYVMKLALSTDSETSKPKPLEG